MTTNDELPVPRRPWHAHLGWVLIEAVHFGNRHDPVSRRFYQGKKAKTLNSPSTKELAQGNFGILRPKTYATLAIFLKKDFEPFIEGKFNREVPKTAPYYKYGIESLLGSDLSKLRLDEITGLYATRLRRLSPATINCELRTLRRASKVAEEWGKLERTPKISLAKGERQRERVLTDDEMKEYLMARRG